MELIEALILGIVQGLTEFLPVSSSGHLEIMKFLLNDDSIAEQSLLTTVFLHFATAFATLVVFRNDILDLLKGLVSGQREALMFSLYIVISMIPAAFVGVFFADWIEAFFHRNILFVAFMLILTGVILFISEKINSGQKEMGVLSAMIIGLSQAIAILPGISRSGSTIATALILGVEKSKAARFSFLMVIPLIFGKIAKDLLSGDFAAHMPSVPYLTIGFLSAFITGIFACTWMINIVKNSKLSWFSYYCFIVGIAIIAYSFYT